MDQNNTKTRPQSWEEDAPAETRERRARQSIARAGRRSAAGAEPGVGAAAGAEAHLQDDEREPWTRPKSEDRFDSGGRWWKPRSSWGRALLICAGLLALGSVTAGYLLARNYLERDNKFRIAGTANIQAIGLNEVTRAELLPVFGGDIGKNIFFVHLDERRRQLEQIPWVEHASVMRVLPDQIRINIVERRPVAFTQIGDQTGLVDASGVLLTMPASEMAQHHYSFPVVTGLKTNETAEERGARMSVYMRLIGELDANNQRNSEQISEIDLRNPDDARVRMIEQGTDITAQLGDDRFLERYQRYKARIGEWRQQYPHLMDVDLRYDNQVVLRMSPQDSGDQAAGSSPQTGQQAGAAAQQTAKSDQKAARSVQQSRTAAHSSAHAPAGAAQKAAAASKKTPKAKAHLERTSTLDKEHAALHAVKKKTNAHTGSGPMAETKAEGQ